MGIQGEHGILWTDITWNPLIGCTEVSPGCAHCYAAKLAATRLRHTDDYKGLTVLDTNRWKGEVRILPQRLEEPLKWKKPRRIFVCDMGDLFHENVPTEFIYKVFMVMWAAKQHTFQVLTKRPDRMNKLVRAWQQADHYLMSKFAPDALPGDGGIERKEPAGQIMQNVWFGTSIENQFFAEQRFEDLIDTPAKVRFLSVEPILGAINLRDVCGYDLLKESQTPSGIWIPRTVHWVICGGESGSQARPMHPDWARSLRDQCLDAGVPFFFKQWGHWLHRSQFTTPLEQLPPTTCIKSTPGGIYAGFGKKKSGRKLDGKIWDEMP